MTPMPGPVSLANSGSPPLRAASARSIPGRPSSASAPTRRCRRVASRTGRRCCSAGTAPWTTRDQRRGPGAAAPPAGSGCPSPAGDRGRILIEPTDGSRYDSEEVVPDVVADRAGRQRAARVDAEQRDWHAQLVRQVVVLEKSLAPDHRPHRCLKPSSWSTSAMVPRSDSSGRWRSRISRRAQQRLARVAARAALRERTARHRGGVLGEVGRSAGRILR